MRHCLFAAAISPAANEAHRMKMAASLHQRVVVGEDKPVNNNTSRDSSRLPHDSPSAEDRHRIYQGRSRDVTFLKIGGKRLLPVLINCLLIYLGFD